MNENALQPWHETQWRRAAAGFSQRRIAHAWLLCGPQGLGKVAFARIYAKSLLCTQVSESGEACARCDSCHLYDVGNHPDILIVEPEDDAKVIAADQIRAIAGFMSLMPQHGRVRVVLVCQAHAMNVHAANSLLKNLEEPPPHGMFILVTDKPSALLPTIRSRCQQLAFTVPPQSQARTWLLSRHVEGDIDVALALADGAPLRALELVQQPIWQRRTAAFEEFTLLIQGGTDPVAMAQKWFDSSAQLLSWMESWLSDLVACKLAPAAGRWRNPDFAAGLTRLSATLDVRSILSALDTVYSALRGTQQNVNQQLALEGTLIGCATLRGPTTMLRHA